MKRALTAALLVLCLALSGCSILDGSGIEGQLRPPRVIGDEEAVQEALDDYIDGDYILTYPRSGDHRAAFLMQDMDGDGENEAICFYRFADSNTHVLLLKQNKDIWEPVDDIVGTGTDIYWVTFGDMRGDGARQLLVGWGIYNNTRDRQAILYDVTADGMKVMLEVSAAAVFFGKVTATDSDSLLLYRIDDNKAAASAILMCWQDGLLSQQGEIALDGHIRSCGTPRLAKLADGVNGVFLDAYKDNNSTITELVYWDGERLNNPFYDPTTNANTVTVRETSRTSSVVSTDINRDGFWEWPSNRRLLGYQESDFAQSQWLTGWMRYDYATGKPVKVMDTVINAIDGYYLVLEEGWMGETAATDRLTVTYDAAKHRLELKEVQNGTMGSTILRIVPKGRELSELAGWETLNVSATETASYTVSYRVKNDLGLTETRVRYMLAAWL